MVDLANSRTRAALVAAGLAEVAGSRDGAVSLRAVARRAGLSHAAPAHFFGDRAGLLTAIATEGFHRLAARLDAAAAAGEGDLAGLGGAYVAFGSENPALTDVMFRTVDLHPDDAELRVAQQAAISRLVGAVSAVRPAEAEAWTVLSWALVHGLVVLGREGALAAFAPAGADAAAFSRGLVELYARELRNS
ncbi:TetR/AcrR family transcriptional regulator [Pseudolysinimonas sp.]